MEPVEPGEEDLEDNYQLPTTNYQLPITNCDKNLCKECTLGINMFDKSQAKSPPITLQAIAKAFRLTGWIGFWVQLVLGVVSAVILLVFATFGQRSGNQSNNPGTGFGIFLAVCGLVTLGVSVYLSFRYTRLGNQLQSSNPNNRPRKIETVQVVRLGVIVNLVGILLTLLGAQAIVGTFTARVISQPQLAFYAQQGNQSIISGLEMLVIQANTNTVTAHFAGLVSSLWLFNRVNK